MTYSFTGATASDTYGRLVQVVRGTTDLYYDGFGNLLNLGPTSQFNIDGGRADSVYGGVPIIDGGGA